MPSKDLFPLFQAIESALDMNEVERILLLLEKDKFEFNQMHELWKKEREQLSILDKINPFSERDQKGEILKIQVQLDDIINVYEKDRKELINMTVNVIYSIPAFVARERMNDLRDAIESISAGGNMVFGRDNAQQKRKKLDSSLIDTYGLLYKNCPPLDKLTSGFLNYLFTPFHLPTELER